MPVTASGTSYASRTATLPGLGRVRWTIADDAIGNSRIPTVIYAHGANGGVGSFAGGTGVAPLREWLMDRRWCVIEGEGGPFDTSGTSFNHWGNSVNRAAYRAYLDYVAGVLDIGPLVAIGSSMGGLVTKWLATRSDIANDIKGLVSLAGVGTIFNGNLDTVATDSPINIRQQSARYFNNPTKGLAAAYGASTYGELVDLAADHAPENWSPDVWAGRSILELYGTADIAVPWAPRGSALLRTIREGKPLLDLAEEHIGLDHALAEGTGMRLDPVTRFLTDVTTTPPPQNRTVLVADVLYVALKGALHPVSFG
jgi:pimeloyl-ACP methyl ester carboxylesterase